MNIEQLNNNNNSFFFTDNGNAARDLGSILIIVGGYCGIVGETISKIIMSMKSSL